MSDRKEFWETVWGKEDGHGFWSQADPGVVSLQKSLPVGERSDVLDLGCGLGRHAIAFAQAGYQVTAADVSETALGRLQSRANELGLRIRTQLSRFDENLFGPETFDLVLAVNVLYHGLPADFAQAISNAHGWLRPHGLLYFTCPTLDDAEYGRGTQVAPHTFEFEPGHVHYNAAWEDLEPLLARFRVISRKRREHRWQKEGVSRSSSRWQVLVEKES